MDERLTERPVVRDNGQRISRCVQAVTERRVQGTLANASSATAFIGAGSGSPASGIPSSAP
eukprot:9018546-Alexandrium_andersonii.AAC.1